MIVIFYLLINKDSILMGICQWEKNMKNAKASERFVQNLLLVMPDWHSKLVKPFRDMFNTWALVSSCAIRSRL